MRLFFDTPRPAQNWVRLRTLVYLRWLAVLGQLIAVVVSTQYLGVLLRLELCLLLIGLSAAVNLGTTLLYPENKRLDQREALLTLLFDIAQLFALLFLTGGLNNPFAVLMLAQTIIAATVLSLGATLMLGSVSLLAVTILAQVHVPLRLADGEILAIPPILVGGIWSALTIAIVFLGVYARRVSMETYSMSEALTATQLALEREQKLTALGGVVAAAAHELGTPLATIMLVSSELADDLSDRPELAEDVALIRAQADRCRQILLSMGESGKEDLHLRYAPFSAVIEEAARPHMNRAAVVEIRQRGTGGAQPEIRRQPELVHGVRNLVQNAVDFAETKVWIDLDWTESQLILRVGDDGAGYPADLLGRIGDPFLRPRNGTRSAERERPGYAGMGLGLFIAKTLLERTGAALTFANGVRPGGPPPDQPSGAIVQVVWERAQIEIPRETVRGALGENLPLAPAP
ncbi:MAG: ActS/PrrB/RegB family redox-sensitive histidine kinase [Pseudomonadota bacterium]